MSKIKIVKDEIIAQDQYLQFKTTQFIDTEQNDRIWSYAERPNNTKAVVIVPVTSDHQEMILIRQFRIPLKSNVIEFPAGLMEKDEDPENCAIRELEEETGYSGKVLQISPLLCTSAGLSSELIYLVLVEVSPQAKAQNLESAEEIEVIKVNLNQAKDKLLQLSLQGNFIDSKIWAFLGMKGF